MALISGDISIVLSGEAGQGIHPRLRREYPAKLDRFTAPKPGMRPGILYEQLSGDGRKFHNRSILFNHHRLIDRDSWSDIERFAKTCDDIMRQIGGCFDHHDIERHRPGDQHQRNGKKDIEWS